VQRDERRGRIRIGIVVVVASLILFVVLFLVGQAEGLFEEKTQVYSDFQLTSGLREGSPVQLAGVEVGRVSDVNYVNVRYACDPLTEDIGRYGAGRTDNCDKRLFCAPTGLCGEFERLADDFHYTRCVETRDCQADEICITTEFRRREPRVLWLGPNGVCGRYATVHNRVRVEMTIEQDALPIIRRDSRATIASNSVLGDQLINITPGVGDPVGPNDRVLSTPSLAEDIELYRLRLERVIETTDAALAAISGLVAELSDRRTIDAIKGLVANLEKISLAVAERRGLVGALVGEPAYKRDFGQILRALGGTTAGVDRIVGQGNHILATADRNLKPFIADVQVSLQALEQLIEDLRDPANRSVVAILLNDPDGEMIASLEAILSQTHEISDAVAHIGDAIDQEKGTLGKLIGDPKFADDLGRLLGNLESNDALKGLLLLVLERRGVGIEASRAPAAPPKQRARPGATP